MSQYPLLIILPNCQCKPGSQNTTTQCSWCWMFPKRRLLINVQIGTTTFWLWMSEPFNCRLNISSPNNANLWNIFEYVEGFQFAMNWFSLSKNSEKFVKFSSLKFCCHFQLQRQLPLLRMLVAEKIFLTLRTRTYSRVLHMKALMIKNGRSQPFLRVYV